MARAGSTSLPSSLPGEKEIKITFFTKYRNITFGGLKANKLGALDRELQGQASALVGDRDVSAVPLANVERLAHGLHDRSRGGEDGLTDQGTKFDNLLLQTCTFGITWRAQICSGIHRCRRWCCIHIETDATGDMAALTLLQRLWSDRGLEANVHRQLTLIRLANFRIDDVAIPNCWEVAPCPSPAASGPRLQTPRLASSNWTSMRGTGCWTIGFGSGMEMWSRRTLSFFKKKRLISFASK